MGDVWFLSMIFPRDKDLDSVEKKFAEAIGTRIDDIKEQEIKDLKELKVLDITRSMPINLTNTYFYLHKNKLNGLAIFTIVSYVSLNGLRGEKRLEFLKKVGVATSKLEPLLAYGGIGGYIEDRLLNAEFEYYSDPYFLCLEPIVPLEDEPGDYDFLFNEKNHETIEKIKKVLPKKELLLLLKKYSAALIQGKQGAGVIRNGFDEAECIWRPRYFLRKAIREIGIDLSEGFTELYYYDFHLKKEPENAPKILSIVNNNIEKKYQWWDFATRNALGHAFVYEPRETYKTFKKYYQTHKGLFGFSQPSGQSIGELLIKEYISSDREYGADFFDKMVGGNVISQEEATKLKTKYIDATKNNDNVAGWKVLGEVAQRLDKKFLEIQ